MFFAKDWVEAHARKYCGKRVVWDAPRVSRPTSLLDKENATFAFGERDDQSDFATTIASNAVDCHISTPWLSTNLIAAKHFFAVQIQAESLKLLLPRSMLLGCSGSAGCFAPVMASICSFIHWQAEPARATGHLQNTRWIKACGVTCLCDRATVKLVAKLANHTS